MGRRKIPETQYRASRVCRILGNTTAYQIIRALGRKRKTPTELADELGLSVAVVSLTLRALRNIDLVRYETKMNQREYWIKETVVLDIADKLEKFVKRIRIKQW
ncbi:MAG TPA: ArsR family transcriptional regulator [bacterium (Candidatus Stahlbacteria)]|nr:ArsR family transcriptional regulator [Candidatus Stahlbacteria bacterium]